MVKPSDISVWLKDIDNEDISYVGDRAANLGELVHAGFVIPEGFIVTSTAFTQFLRYNKFEKPILHLLNTINYEDPDSINQVSSHIQKLIISGQVPSDISKSLFDYYEKIDKQTHNPRVQIYAAFLTTKKNIPSYIPQLLSNIQGESSLINAVRQIWSNVFDVNALHYYHKNKIDPTNNKIILTIQREIDPRCSGVLFTTHPVNKEKTEIIIEAIYGMKEQLISDNNIMDQYIINKKDMTINTKNLAQQDKMMIHQGLNNAIVSVPKNLRKKQKLSDKEINSLAEYAKRLEKHHFFPQSAEWVIENDQVYLIRSIPAIEKSNIESSDNRPKISNNYSSLLLLGDPVNPGIGIGRAILIKNTKDLANVKQGDILVADCTTIDYLPAMKKAAAIISRKGGRQSHTAIAARSIGIPAITSVPHAFEKVANGMILTVNGKTGEVIKGSIKLKNDYSGSIPQSRVPLSLYFSDAESTENYSLMPVSGVGLLRLDNLILGLGKHPKKLLRDKKSNEFVRLLSEDIGEVCKIYYPRSVNVSLSDLSTFQYHSLHGGSEYEPSNTNSQLGYRGSFRHISDPQLLKLELEVVKEIRDKKNMNNLNLVIPHLRSVRELELIKKAINSAGLRRSNTFKILMMCELPSNVLLIDDYLRVGIDGVIIDLEKLATMILGTDPEDDNMSAVFDPKDPSVLWALEQVIASCNKRQVPVSIYSKSFSLHPEIIQKVLKWKITSIIVTPEEVKITSEFINKLK